MRRPGRGSWRRRSGDFAGGWPVPERARTVVDTSYVLAAAGLLASEHPQAAARLLRSALLT